MKSPRVTSPIKSPRSTSPVKSPRVKPLKVTSPLKSPKVAYPIKTTSPVKADSPTKVTNPVTSSLVGKSTAVEESIKENKKELWPDRQNSNSHENSNQTCNKLEEKNMEALENSNKDREKTTSAPTRARLRRFGKVNITASRGVKTADSKNKTASFEVESQGDSANGRGDEQEKNDKPEHNKEPNVTEVDPVPTELKETDKVKEGDQEKCDLSNDEKPDELSKKKEAIGDNLKPKVPTRARLPKAKPNLLDAGRKRAK